MRTEQEIQRKYEQVFKEDNLVDSLDDRLITHSKLKILEWVLKSKEDNKPEK